MAYVRVLDGSARFDGKSTFKSFLFGVIRRTAMEQRRSRWLAATRLTRWLTARPEPEPAGDPEASSMRRERIRALTEALPRLSGRQRQVLHLVFSQGLTIEEAAAVLGVATGSARRHYERGKARLRELLPSRGPR